MRGYLKDPHISHILFIGVWITYTITCLTRNTYSTAIAAIVNEGLFTKAASGTISAAFYLFYGTAQFVAGYLCDRISAPLILLIGLVGSLVSNGVMAVSDSFTVMLVAWSINGLCQCGVWPATFKIVSTMIMAEHRKRGLIFISLCMCVGTVISYLSGMVLLNLFSWPSVFVFGCILATVAIILWTAVCSKVKPFLIMPKNDAVNERKSENRPKVNLLLLCFTSGFILLLIPSVLRCMLDNGAKSWVPTMMMESYGISPGFSSFLTTLVVLINASGVFLVSKFYPKYCKNTAKAAAILFALSLPMFGGLLFIGRIPMLFATILLIAATTVMYGINQLLNIEVPAAFGKYERNGTIAGIMNSFGSYGVMLGNLLYGIIADASGWTAVIVTWIVLAAVSMLCCAAAIVLWRRFTE